MATGVLISKFLISFHLFVVKINSSENVAVANEQQKYRIFVVWGNQLTSRKVVSLGMCSYHCLCIRNCVSFFFNTERRVCKLHSVLFPSSAFWTPDKAWAYYQMNGGECEPSLGYIHQRHLSLCYKRHSGTGVRSASDAELVCQEDDGELVRVDSDEKQKHLTEYLDIIRDEKIYIQGSDDNEEGTWRFNDGEKMSYFHWSSSHNPDVDSALNYLVMTRSSRYGWHSVSGNETLPFICEKRI